MLPAVLRPRLRRSSASSSGVPTLTKQAEDFGYSIYGSASQYVPGLDLPNVVPSTFSDLPPTAQADLAYSAIGQYNDAATPLQNALVAAGIANGGVIMTPHLMEQITDSQGAVVKTYKPTPMLTVSTPAAAAAVSKSDAGAWPRHRSGRHGERDLPGLVARGGQDGYGAGPGADRPRADRRLDDRLPAGRSGPRSWPSPWSCPTRAYSVTGAQMAGPIVKQVFQAYLNETGGHVMTPCCALTATARTRSVGSGRHGTG